MKEIKLRPIKEATDDYERAEKAILELLRKELYIPIMQELGAPKNQLQNSIEDLNQAILSGRITFYRGAFKGRLSSSISRELRQLGAEWDRKQGQFKIPLRSLPQSVRATIQASESRMKAKLAGIDRKLSQLLPAKIADKLQVSKYFDTALWKVERDFQSSIKNITVGPQLTKEQSAKIADEWQTNMKLWVKDFTEKEISRLRKDVQASVFTGNRYESMISKIQKSYGVSANKAKFLARQETSLLMTKFKETRYRSAGVNEYKWGCVAGSKNHPVRASHKILEGKIFRWDNPPITTAPGEPVRKNNPGQDYNCRCFAQPIVRFKS